MSSTVALHQSVLAGRTHVAALHAVTVVQPRPNGQQIVLEDVSTTFQPGELTAVLSRYDGAARAVLDVLSGQRSPAWGAVVVAGTEINRLDHRAMLAVRDAHVARVWPGFALHPKLTVRANLEVALRQSGRGADEATSARIATIGDLLDLHGKLGFQDGPGDARRVCSPSHVPWPVARSWSSPTTRPGASPAGPSRLSSGPWHGWPGRWTSLWSSRPETL